MQHVLRVLNIIDALPIRYSKRHEGERERVMSEKGRNKIDSDEYKERKKK